MIEPTGQTTQAVADFGRNEPAGVSTDTRGVPTRQRSITEQVFASSALTTILAIVLSLVAGSILIILTDQSVIKASSYFFGRPGDTLVAAWNAIAGAYSALFRGGVFNYQAATFLDAIAPLFNSVSFATPLIAAGLGVAVAFRAGAFNIGAQGQILIAASAAGWVGFAVPMPPVIHMLVAVLAALVGGAVWAGIVGVLKAKTGAHEVIVTIMLNYVAFYLVDYLLRTPVLQAPGSSNPRSPAELPTSLMFNITGGAVNLNVGFVLVIIAAVFTWWLMSHSGIGFRLRAVGENPRAARVAGMNVNRIFIVAMIISGALIGFAGAYQVLATTTTGFGSGIDAGIGFTAITVALLGRSRPGGVFAAGILFGILQAGGYTMAASQNIAVDLVTVLQSLIVLFIAAPPLVRTIFRIPQPGRRRPRRQRKARA